MSQISLRCSGFFEVRMCGKRSAAAAEPSTCLPGGSHTLPSLLLWLSKCSSLASTSIKHGQTVSNRIHFPTSSERTILSSHDRLQNSFTWRSPKRNREMVAETFRNSRASPVGTCYRRTIRIHSGWFCLSYTPQRSWESRAGRPRERLASESLPWPIFRGHPSPELAVIHPTVY